MTDDLPTFVARLFARRIAGIGCCRRSAAM